MKPLDIGKLSFKSLKDQELQTINLTNCYNEMNQSSDRLKLTTEDQRLLFNELQGFQNMNEVSFSKTANGESKMQKEENIEQISSPENNNIFYWVDKLTGEDPRKSLDHTQVLQSRPGDATLEIKSMNNDTQLISGIINNIKDIKVNNNHQTERFESGKVSRNSNDM